MSHKLTIELRLSLEPKFHVENQDGSNNSTIVMPAFRVIGLESTLSGVARKMSSIAMLKILFVCDANRLRSPTAEAIFSGYARIEVKSAGVGKEATIPVSLELLEWANLVFVMEKRQRNIIHSRFKEIFQRKRIICLYIPDEYELMDPDLIALLVEKVTPYIQQCLAIESID